MIICNAVGLLHGAEHVMEFSVLEYGLCTLNTKKIENQHLPRNSKTWDTIVACFRPKLSRKVHRAVQSAG